MALSTKVSILDKGEKDIFNVEYSNGRILRCNERDLEDYDVENGSELICDRAFANRDKLVNIYLPDSVKAIGESAFSGCRNLKEINIPEGVEEIKVNTFNECNALEEITLPSTIKNIDKFAFDRGLKSLTILSPSAHIHRHAFLNCRNLESIKVPEGYASFYEAQFKEAALSVEINEMHMEIEGKDLNESSNQENIKGQSDNEILKKGFLECIFSIENIKYWQTYVLPIVKDTFRKLKKEVVDKTGYDVLEAFSDAEANPCDAMPILMASNPEMKLRLLDNKKNLITSYWDEYRESDKFDPSIDPLYFDDIRSDIEIGASCKDKEYAHIVQTTLKAVAYGEIEGYQITPSIFINKIGKNAGATCQIDYYYTTKDFQVRVLFPIEWEGEFDFEELKFISGNPEKWPELFEEGGFGSESYLVDAIVYKNAIYVKEGLAGILNSEEDYGPEINYEGLPDLDDVGNERTEVFGLVTAKELKEDIREYAYDEDIDNVELGERNVTIVVTGRELEAILSEEGDESSDFSMGESLGMLVYDDYAEFTVYDGDGEEVYTIDDFEMEWEELEDPENPFPSNLKEEINIEKWVKENGGTGFKLYENKSQAQFEIQLKKGEEFDPSKAAVVPLNYIFRAAIDEPMMYKFLYDGKLYDFGPLESDGGSCMASYSLKDEEDSEESNEDNVDEKSIEIIERNEDDVLSEIEGTPISPLLKDDFYGIYNSETKEWIIEPKFEYAQGYMPIGKNGELLAYVWEKSDSDTDSRMRGYYMNQKGEKVDLEKGENLTIPANRKVEIVFNDFQENKLYPENSEESLNFITLDKDISEMIINGDSYDIDNIDTVEVREKPSFVEFLREKGINRGRLYSNTVDIKVNLQLAEDTDKFDLSKVAFEINRDDWDGNYRNGYLNLVYDGVRYPLIPENIRDTMRCSIKLDGDIIKTGYWENKDPYNVEESENLYNNEGKNKITLYLYTEGVRIDIRGEEETLIDCEMAIREESIQDIDVYINDEEAGTIDQEDLGKPLTMYDDDDPDFDEDYDWGGYWDLYKPKEVFKDAKQLVWDQSKVGAEINIELEAGEKFNPKKLRLLVSEMPVPEAEFEVYCGALYNGKIYPIEIDIDSEDVKNEEIIWEAED